MLFSSAALAAIGFATFTSAHMMMGSPVPFGKSSLNNSPLKGPEESTSDFPCKQRAGVYDAEGASNIMPLGSSQKLAFIGSAVHGGGSCQISITYDQAPTAASTWKVIHSIEGGCPAKGQDGNLPKENAAGTDANTYTFTIPSSLPTGTAVLAWTWFNKVGNREMYMNCAPISITAATTKRSDEEEELMRRNYTQLLERDTAAYNALPNMFVANIPGTTCKTVDGDLRFPNPGTSLDLFGTSALFDPTGSCAVGDSSGGSATSAKSAPSTTMKTSVKSTASVPANQGGVFVTVGTTSTAANQATKSPVVSSAVPSSAIASKVSPVASSVVVSSAIASKASPVASSAAPVGTGTGSTGSAFAAGTACSTEGMWNCIAGTSFQQCASGTWSVVQTVAAGTKCTGGQSMSMSIAAVASKDKAKRNVRHSRFSGAHIRRHLHS